MKQKLIALLAALGVTLDPNADETTTATALDTALANYTKEEKKEGASTANKEKAKTESAPEGMSAEVSAMRAEIEQMRKETVIAEATRAGKVIPLSAAAIKVTPLSAIIELADNATPGAVPLKKKTVDGKEVPLEIGAKPDALSAETLAMAASMGLSEADLKKYAAEG
jgi:phage I-like protein